MSGLSRLADRGFSSNHDASQRPFYFFSLFFSSSFSLASNLRVPNPLQRVSDECLPWRGSAVGCGGDARMSKPQRYIAKASSSSFFKTFFPHLTDTFRPLKRLAPRPWNHASPPRVPASHLLLGLIRDGPLRAELAVLHRIDEHGSVIVATSKVSVWQMRLPPTPTERREATTTTTTTTKRRSPEIESSDVEERSGMRWSRWPSRLFQPRPPETSLFPLCLHGVLFAASYGSGDGKPGTGDIAQWWLLSRSALGPRAPRSQRENGPKIFVHDLLWRGPFCFSFRGYEVPSHLYSWDS